MIGKKRKRAESESIVEDEVIQAGKKDRGTFHEETLESDEAGEGVVAVTRTEKERKTAADFFEETTESATKAEGEVAVARAKKKRKTVGSFDATSESVKAEEEIIVAKTKKKSKSAVGGDEAVTCLSEPEESLQKEKDVDEILPVAEKEPQPKEPPPPFCVNTFVRSLQGPECVQALKAFVKEAESDAGEGDCDVVGQFLSAGRTPEDVLKVVNTSEKKNMAVPVLAFSAARLIIMRLLRDSPDGRSPLAESACTFVIRAHLPIVHTMLSMSSDPRQRKVALRLLSVVVTVSPELAQEVARNVTLSPPALVVLTHRPHRKGKTNVRTCFIHFLLAFLVNGSGATCRLLLEKKGYLNSIIPGLVQDSADTVVLVLTTLREKVLENPAISKTVKVHVFNVPTVRSLVALYDWKGPHYVMMHPGRKRKSGVEVIQPEPDSAEKELVAETAHELLLKLCCSTKHGVVFHDQSLGTSGVKHNPVMAGVLQGMERPWENKWSCELAVKMLKACPDLVRTLWPLMETLLVPRASHKWLDALSFVEQVLPTFDPSASLKQHSASFTPEQLCNLLLSFSTPAPVLKVVGARGLEHPHLTVRNKTAVLLGSMLSLLCRRLETVRSWPGVVVPEDAVTTFLVQHLPPPHMIYAAWGTPTVEVSEESEEILPAPVAGAHESSILELLLLYRRCCPQLLDASEFGQEFGGLLPAVLAMDRGGDGCDAVARLQVKAVQLLLSVDSQAFAPDKALFTDTGLLLFDLLSWGKDADLRCDVSSTLASLLESTGLFELAHQEVLVWLHCYRAVDPDRRPTVARFLLGAIKELSANVKLYVGLMHRAEEAAAATQTHQEPAGVNVDTVEDILRGLMEKDHGKQRTSRLKCESLSPLLVAALHSDADDAATVATFLSFVVVHLLHSQISPPLLLEVVRLTPDRLPRPLVQYLEGWAGAGDPLPLKRPFPSGSPTRRLSEKLLRPDPEDCKLFARADVALDAEEDLPALAGQAVFYVTQLAARGRLTPSVAGVLGALLLRAEEAGCLEACARRVLLSPALVRAFDPLGVGDAGLLSRAVASVVQLLRERLPALESLLEPLKDRFVACLTGRRQLPVTVDAERLAEAFKLSREDILALLEACASLDWGAKCSSGWGQLLVHLLREASRARIGEVPGATLGALLNRMAGDCSDKALLEALEAALTQFLCSCPHLIGAVPTSFLESSLTSDSFRSSSAQLLTLLIGRSRKLRAAFSASVLSSPVEEVVGNCTLFPRLFAEFVNREGGGEDFAKVCEVARQSYGGELRKFLKKPAKVKDWMAKSFPAIEAVMKHCFDVSSFSKMKVSVFQNLRDADSVDELYLRTVEKVCELTEDASCQGEFLGALLESTARLAAREDPEALLHITGTLRRRVSWVAGGNLLGDHSAFLDVALKYGLRGENGFQRELLMLLPDLCDGGILVAEEKAKVVFEKLVSHSRFLDIILGKSDSKCDVLQLLLVLVRKVPSVMSADHVPVLLGAYNASLSSADQLILQLLQLYESSGVALQGCQPYLWGEAAVNYFSVRNRAGPSLWSRPHAGQVLDLLDSSYVEWTVTRFPYHRELKASATVPADPDLYDPAFLLPLLSHILAPESPVPDYKVMQSGAVAIALSALGSRSKEARAAACHVLARFHGHLEGSRSAKLWLHFLEAVRGGVARLVRAEGEGGEDPGEAPELPCVVALFLARASLIISQPTHPMYLPLHNFVLAKPAMDLSIVPEFLVLFHSSTLDHKTHRHWILEVLRDGICYWKDVALCLHCVLYKMIMDFYSSTLADTRTKVLCLSVLESTLKIPKAARLLVRSYGVVPWLTHSVNRLEGSAASLRGAMLDVLTALASSDAAPTMLPTLLLLLLPHLERTSPAVLKFLTALDRAMTRRELPPSSPLTRGHLDFVVRVCREVLGSVGDCEALLRYGTEFSDPETVPNPSAGEVESAQVILRNIVCRWIKNTTDGWAPEPGDS